MSDDDEQWYYCLKHKTVEQGMSCAGTERLGPYATERGGPGGHRARGGAHRGLGQRPPLEGRLTRYGEGGRPGVRAAPFDGWALG